MSDHLDKPHDRNKLRSQTGDRRAIYFLERQDHGNRLVICAEPFAGALAVRGAASGVNLTGYGSANDAVTATIQAVDARAAAVRLYEDAAHEYCKRYQDGTLTPNDYTVRLDEITKRAFDALAVKPPAPTESAGSTAASKSTPPPLSTTPPNKEK